MKILKGKNGMTTKQIKQQLQTTLNISPIVNLMCDQGLLIRGTPEKGWKSNMHTYYLLNEYFPGLKLNTMDEKAAKKAVIRQYLASFGPATENDVSWWSRFTKGQIRPIIARALVLGLLYPIYKILNKKKWQDTSKPQSITKRVLYQLHINGRARERNGSISS